MIFFNFAGGMAANMTTVLKTVTKIAQIEFISIKRHHSHSH